MRSMSTRGSKGELAEALDEAVLVCQHAGFDFIIVETSGIGQGDADIIDHCDVSMYVMTSEFGAWSQLEKIDMLDFADLVAVNKFEKGGSQDALRAVRKQVRRNRQISYDVPDEQLPVFGTIASQFNDTGVNALYEALLKELGHRDLEDTHWEHDGPVTSKRATIIPPERSRYLAEIAEACRGYRAHVEQQSQIASDLYRLEGARELLGPEQAEAIEARCDELEEELTKESRRLLDGWEGLKEEYSGEVYELQIRDKTLEIPLATREPVGLAHPQDRAAEVARRRGHLALADARERARALPVHRRGLPVQAQGRGAQADVRRRGHARPDQPPVPLSV